MAFLPTNIFRAYDVRGRVADELSPSNVQLIGQAFANRAAEAGYGTVLVAGDVRHSTPVLREALHRGLTQGGIHVIDVGTVPTPVLYYAVHELSVGAGIVITGSHNPPEYNGLKFVLDYVPFAAEELLDLRRRIIEEELQLKSGNVRNFDVLDSYIHRVTDDIKLERPLRIAVDCGNAVTGVLVPQLFETLGCEVVTLFDELDGSFPNHHPDPADPRNMQDLVHTVLEHSLELGIGFDGDGDRIGVVTSEGKIVPADTLIAFLAGDVLRDKPGVPIVLDVKCGTHAIAHISQCGGQPILEKTGHTNIKARIRKLNAPLGGEFSGHICLADRWYGFDDALYVACRLLESLAPSPEKFKNYLATLPPTFSTPEIDILSTDDEKFDLVELFGRTDFGDQCRVTKIDGVRIEYEHAWGLLRASNTSPKLVLRFEASSKRGLKEIQGVVYNRLHEVAPHLTIPASNG